MICASALSAVEMVPQGGVEVAVASSSVMFGGAVWSVVWQREKQVLNWTVIWGLTQGASKQGPSISPQ